jgi:hypothetical protein
MIDKKTLLNEQHKICSKYNMPFFDSPFELKVGIARNVLQGIIPINGLRHNPEGETTGWYIWAGEEFSEAADFFVPLHVIHLEEWCPVILKYLGLPPGSRFLVAEGYEDVWEDESLLED